MKNPKIKLLVRLFSKWLLIIFMVIGATSFFAASSIANITNHGKARSVSQQHQQSTLWQNNQNSVSGCQIFNDDQEGFFSKFDSVSNPTNTSKAGDYTVAKRGVTKYFIYNQATYFIVEADNKSQKTKGLLIIQEPITKGPKKSHNQATTTSFYEFIEYPQQTSQDAHSSPNLSVSAITVFNTGISSQSSDNTSSEKCFIAFLTNISISGENKINSVSKGNLFYAAVKRQDNPVVARHLQVPRVATNTFYSALSAEPPAVSSDKSTESTLILAPLNTKKLQQPVLYFFEAVDGKTQNDVNFSLIKITTCVVSNLPGNHSTLLQSKVKSFVISSIKRDNYEINEKSQTHSNILFLQIKEIGASLQYYYGDFDSSSSQHSRDIRIYSFRQLASMANSSLKKAVVETIRIDYRDNIWFSATMQENLSSKNDEKYLFILDTNTMSSRKKNCWGFCGITNAVLRNKKATHLFTVRLINPIDSANGFEVANIVSIDYGNKYKVFENAKKQGRELNVESTVYMDVRSRQNINDVWLEAGNLSNKQNTSANAETSYVNIHNWNIIDTLKKNSSFSKPIYLLVSQINVVQQQMYYSQIQPSENNVVFSMHSKSCANQTNICVQVNVNNDSTEKQLLVWRFSSIDDIFTKENPYDHWKGANNEFHTLNSNCGSNKTVPFFNTCCSGRNSFAYIEKWQFNHSATTWKNANYFLAGGPFVICCDMSTTAAHQHVNLFQKNGSQTIQSHDYNINLNMTNAGSIIQFKSGAAYKNNIFLNKMVNPMTRQNDNVQITIMGFSQTVINIGITAINFTLLDLDGKNSFFQSQQGNSATNNIGDNTMIKFRISRDNFLQKKQDYFESNASVAGFYYFFRQKSIILNFDSPLFRNNTISAQESLLGVAKIIAVENLTSSHGNLTYRLPLDSINPNVANVILGPKSQSQQTDQWTLTHSSNRNSDIKKNIINSNVIIAERGKKSNTNIGLFLIQIDPTNIDLTVHSDPVYIMVQVGGDILLSANNVHYINLNTTTHSKQFIIFIAVFSLIFIMLIFLLIFCLVFVSKLKRYALMLDSRRKLLALNSTATNHEEAGKEPQKKKARSRLWHGVEKRHEESKQMKKSGTPTLSSFFEDDDFTNLI